METWQKNFDCIYNSPVKYFVDIGASCVSCYSQSEAFISMGFSGLMVECDPQKYTVLIERYKNNPNIKIVTEPITPTNVLDILKNNGVPDGFYLSLDIDGYDYFVLDTILSQYSPSVIISEINEKIPAPIKFAVQYVPGYFWDGTHYFGYSISMLEELLEKYGYMIKSLDKNNVVLIKGVQTQSIEEIYKTGYLNTTDRHTKFHYNQDFEPIYTMSKPDQLNFIRAKFDPFFNDRQPIPFCQLNGVPITHRTYILE